VSGPRRSALGRWLPWAVLAAAFAANLLRCTRSFCWADESFYLAIAHRFWLGELPFVDEWYHAQVYVVLLMPFYSLYRALFGSAQGVYLAARLVFVCLSGAASAFVYTTLKKREGRAAALAAALLCLFYSRANIEGLSYYNLSLLFCAVGAAALYRAFGRADGGALLHCFFAGACMALAVVCSPFFALLWAVMALLPLPRFARWRRAAACFLLGTAASACCYLAWLLARVSPAQILEMLPYVLSTPEANVRSLKTLLMAFALPAYQFRYTLPLWGGALVWAAWRVLVRRRPFAAREAVLPAGLSLAALAANLLLCGRMPGRPHAALCLTALCLFLLLPAGRRPMRCFWCFGLPGAVLAVSWQLSSDTRFSAMTIGFALASIWAAVTAARFAGWLRAELCGPAGWQDTPRRGAKARLLRALPMLCLVLCLAGPVLAAAVQRMVLVYRDDPIQLCTTRIEAGPARGLYTSAENARLYREVYEVLAALPDGSGPLYLSSLLPWGYLVNDLRCGAPGSWRTPLDHVQLPDYYRVNPQNFPRTVLVLDAGYGRYRSTVEGTEEPCPNANVTEGWFLNELAARGYRCTRTPCGLLYQAP